VDDCIGVADVTCINKGAVVTVLHYAGITSASLGQMHGARDGGGKGRKKEHGEDRFRVLIIVRWVLPAPQPDLR
jgi:hypothetical protein